MSKKEDNEKTENSGGCFKWIVIGLAGYVAFMIIFLNWRDITNAWHSWMYSLDKDKVESLHNDYVKACEECNFEEAYKIVNKINTIDYFEAKKAEKYVVLHEATYALENEGIDGLTRISFIAKEHNAKWLYKDLLDIAVSKGDAELETRLRKLAGNSKDDDDDDFFMTIEEPAEVIDAY